MSSQKICLPAQWQDWRIVRTIGQGGYGAVYEICRDILGSTERAALKVISIPRNPSDIDNLRSEGYDTPSITAHFRNHLESIIQEYTLMADMKGHTNIVYCDDLKYIRHNDGIGWDIYIKMELLTPMMTFLPQQIGEDQVIRLGADICSALAFCKRKNIIHRDIKPQNIFVSRDGSYKLGDFGVAKMVEKTMYGTKVGTYSYMAPEVYRGMPYGDSADIYSLGLVLYWMLNSRRLPFMPMPPQVPTLSQAETARHCRFRGDPLPPPRNGSPRLKAIVLKACAFDPADRYASAEEMLRDLNALSNPAIQAWSGGASRECTERTATIGRPTPINRTPVYTNTPVTPASYEEYTAPLPPRGWQQPQQPPAYTPPRKKKGAVIGILCGLFLLVAALLVCYFTVHFWDTGSCTQAVTCKLCGKVKSRAPGHDWIDATCTSAKTCQVCGKVSGDPLDHDWADASCTTESTCRICGETSGSALGHDWAEATYDAPRTCTRCGLTDGESLSYQETLTKEEILGIAEAYAADGQYMSALQTLDEAYKTYGYRDFYDAMVQYRMDFGIYCTSRIAAGKYNTVICHSNGTVTVYGDDVYEEDAANSWTGIAAVSAGDRHIIGLKTDGTVVAAGCDTNDQCAVSGWKNVVAISAGDVHTAALLQNGAVVATGYNKNGQCNVGNLMSNAGNLKIVAIASGYTHTLALLEDGRVVACGDPQNGSCDVSGWRDMAMICAGTEFSAGLKMDGSVVVTGKDVGNWDLSGWTDIVMLAAGDYYLVGLRANGTVVVKEIDSYENPNGGQADVHGFTNVISIAAGNDHTVAITSDGTILCAGGKSCNKGQCDCANTTRK